MKDKKSKVKEQITFIKEFLRSLDEVKRGNVTRFRFSDEKQKAKETKICTASQARVETGGEGQEPTA